MPENKSLPKYPPLIIKNILQGRVCGTCYWNKNFPEATHWCYRTHYECPEIRTGSCWEPRK